MISYILRRYAMVVIEISVVGHRATLRIPTLSKPQLRSRPAALCVPPTPRPRVA
jgi:hypothetical protein